MDPGTARAVDPASKPRVLLSVLKCACFEHLEGEQLFTAICAGYGRFECERLLKPSGVELMNLPPSTSIEVSVLRRCPGDLQRPKQLLYHGLVSLSQVFPSLAGGTAEAQLAQGERHVWESWLGLFSSDVNLKAQSPDRLFQRCQEMGSSGARFPRLLLRLQYLPPGVTAVPPQPAVPQPGAAPSQAPLSQASETSLPSGGGSAGQPGSRPRSVESASGGAPEAAPAAVGGPLAAPAPAAAAPLFYKPLATDPADCLLAASLMQLAAEVTAATRRPAAPAPFQRLAQSLYRFGGPGGPRLRLQVEGGKVALRRVGSEEDASGVFGTGGLLEVVGPAMDLRDFLAAQSVGEAVAAAH